MLPSSCGGAAALMNSERLWLLAQDHVHQHSSLDRGESGKVLLLSEALWTVDGCLGDRVTFLWGFGHW